jgi:energy-coupling factor transport system permease protein
MGGVELIPRLGYISGSSFLHRLDPVTKLIALICGVTLVIFYGGLVFSILFFITVIILFIISKIDLMTIYKKFRFILTFGLIILISHLIFLRTGDVLIEVRPFIFAGVQWPLLITTQGILTGLEITFRFFSIITASMLFVATTDPTKLAYSVMSAGLPYRYGFMLIVTLRFIPVFDMEASVVQYAQRARGLEIDTKRMGKIFKLTKYTFVPLLASALSRVNSLTRSMEARGFGLYKKRTYLKQVKPDKVDWVVGVGAVGLTITLLFLKYINIVPILF